MGPSLNSPIADGAPALRERLRGSDAGPPRYGLLLLTSFASLIVQGTAQPGALQQVLVTFLAGAALVLAFRAAEFGPRVQTVAAVGALTGLALTIVDAAGGGIGDGAGRLVNAALLLLGPPAVAKGVVHDLRRTRQVRVQTVMGVLSLYMLVGMLFGFVYGAIDRLGGAPFFADGAPADVAHCLYFSFVTLTTTGYGDLVARSDLGHTLSILEALIGQIYLVTVVSVVVSNLGRPTRAAGRLSDATEDP